ncbi:MFS allantoate transporter [Metarhizium anisopliae]|nr:MFS allantoate transporter [Metarhizium anisopliae]
MGEARSQRQPPLGAGNPGAENEKAEAASSSGDDPITSPKASYNKSSGVDAALELVNKTRDLSTAPLDPAQEKRLVRRIDCHIMPLICVVYFLQYIDKTSISYASVTGIQEATGLVGNQFNWVASIFFFGQLAFEFPTIRLIQLFPLAKYASINAAVVPAWVLFTSQWYTKKEQAFRVGIWFSVCGAAQMFGGFFAYGVARHGGSDPNAALQGWQIIFLFLGLLTSVVGIAFYFLIPDSPATARFLTMEDKAAHIRRIRSNEQGIGSDKFKWSQVKEALTDSMTWLYCFWIFAANIPNSTATSFGNLLVKGMGYSSQESLILVTPLGAYEIVALLGLTWLAMKTRQRIWWCIAGHVPAIIGAILMATTSRVPALIGYYLTGGIPIGWTTILGLQSTNVAGSTKKVTVACLGTVAYTVGNIISPQTFQKKDAPRYLPAKISICIIYFLCVVDLYAMRWVLARRNRIRDQEKAAAGASYVVEENHEFLDLTDVQNKEFRYEL